MTSVARGHLVKDICVLSGWLSLMCARKRDMKMPESRVPPFRSERMRKLRNRPGEVDQGYVKKKPFAETLNPFRSVASTATDAFVRVFRSQSGVDFFSMVWVWRDNIRALRRGNGVVVIGEERR